MIRTFRFNKEEDNRWFVDLPEWEGEKDELEMVLGADIMLDILSEGNSVVDVLLSDEPFNHNFEMNFLREDSNGGWYLFRSEFTELEIWLCEVTKFVFGGLPKTIYGA